MSAPAAFFLRIQPNRKATFEDALLDGSEFSESVRTFDHSATSPLVCLILTASEVITHIGFGHPVRGKDSAGTGLRKLRVDDIRALQTPILTSSVLAAMDSRVRRFAQSAIEDGGIVREKTFQNLIDTIRQLSAEAAAFLSAFASERRARIQSLTQNVREVLAAQKDTVAVALNIAGIDRDELLGWDPSTKTVTGQHRQTDRFDPKSMVIGLFFRENECFPLVLIANALRKRSEHACPPRKIRQAA